MNLPPQIQKQVKKWADLQGIDPEQFIVDAIAEKVNRLDRQIDESSAEVPRTYYEKSVLVAEAELPGDFDLNQFIDDLREERIQKQIQGESFI
ncbi:hypothetical protein LEP3755_33090 [Leptolyngbya sp. NIES-3755]|nr:hypothetical protein LEP3755_33090 [Leptolyngbya sp. NIES-3755]